MVRDVMVWAVVLVLGLVGVGGASAELAPIAQGVGPDGWTVFEKSPDTRVIYVSSSQGDDANDGLSPEKPVKTLEKGMSLLRHEHPDWLLLRRGDEWEEGLSGWFNGNRVCGRSAAAPIVIGAYGEGPRPLLKVGESKFFHVVTGRSMPVDWQGVRNVAIAGLHIYDHTGDPHSPHFDKSKEKGGEGLSWQSTGANLLIEDCYFDYTGLAVVGHGPRKKEVEEKLTNFQLRRCVVANNWSSSGHCQGMFLNDVHGALIEECVFDHNGWNLEVGDRPTWFNHNIYISIRNDGIVARGNIIARGSTTGIYCRTNGVLKDNLCMDNSPSLNLGRIRKFRPGGVTGRIVGNVVIGAGVRDLPQVEGLSAGPAIEMANVNYKGAVVERNIVIGDPYSGRPAFNIGGHGVGAHNIKIRSNTVYRWAPAFWCFASAGEELGRGNASGIEVQDNVFVGTADYGEDLIEEKRGDANISYEGNVCYPSSGRAGMGQPGREEPVAFVDPTRTAATYHGTLGREATRQAFLTETYRQSKFNWRPEYTAATVIEYIREGFRRKDAGQ